MCMSKAYTSWFTRSVNLTQPLSLAAYTQPHRDSEKTVYATMQWTRAGTGLTNAYFFFLEKQNPE